MNKLLLLSGNDIPFSVARISIHQPTIKEIAYIGENRFYSGCELLTFSKEKLQRVDKTDLSQYNDFDIIMSMITSKNLKSQNSKINFLSVLSLLFPEYSIQLNINPYEIVLTKQNKEEEEKKIINAQMFKSFKEIINEMFCLSNNKKEQGYNPQGDLASKIAEKLYKGRQKVNQIKGKNTQDIYILSHFVSILSTGLQKDMNSLMNYTVPQLFDEYKRFEMKIQYDIYVKQKLAGAKNVKEVDFWMKNIYE